MLSVDGDFEGSTIACLSWLAWLGLLGVACFAWVVWLGLLGCHVADGFCESTNPR